MSGPPLPTIGLDARAAELKEKLLKSRGQPRPKTAQLKTDDVNTSSNAAASTAPKASSSDVTPRETPKPPAPHSFQADEDDIAALISSISGAATRESEANSSNPLSDSSHQEETATAKVATASAAPTSGNRALPPKPALLPPKPAPKITIPKPEAVETQSKQSTQQATRPPAASETKQPTPTSLQQTSKPHQPFKQLDRAPTAFAKKPVKKEENAQENASSVVPPAPKAPTLEPARKVAERDDTKNGNILVEKTAPNRDTSQTYRTSSVNSHQETGRERTNPTSANPSTRDRADSRKSPPKPMGPPAATVSPTASARDTGASAATANGKHTGHPETISPDDAFTRLLNQVPDLRDFLEMSDYYDVEARTRKLTRFRRLKALAAERLRLEEEERKLMQEEEIDMGLQRSTVARFASVAPSVAPSAASDMETNGLPTPITPVTKNSIGAREIKEPTSANGTKRAREEDAPRDRQEKAPRLEEPLPPRVKDMDDRSRHDDRYRENEHRRDDLRRDSRSRPDDRASRSSPPRRRHRDEDDYDGHHRYDSYKDDDRRHRDLESRSKYPVRVDLGSNGDTRFFIVKSFNHENVRICMEEDLWTTQAQNEDIFAEAFAKCKNVILFFSINGSKAFQGYARMTSAPSRDNPRPSFVKGHHWDTSPFRVQWLSKTAVQFFRIGHLKNAYNEYRPVLVGKDGQEIDEECGPKLLREMEDIAAAESPNWGESGGSGGGGGSGGHSWGRYGEREGERR